VRRMRLTALVILLIVSGGCGAVPDAAPAPNGVWLTESGNFEIEIAPCGAALCGKVSKVLANHAMAGSGMSSPSNNTGAMLGRNILTDLRPTGNGSFRGSIFNRENGKTYDCEIRALSADRLKVRAYKLLPLFGKTQIWTRAVNLK
jgi:uncharacterized protein (DUF2147 family)